MVTPDGRVLLMDFGLATSAGTHRLTRTGTELGSLPYMASEQVRGESGPADGRTDIYGLGVTLYEMLTLRLPFLEDSAEATRRGILDGAPASARAANRAVSWDV